VPVLPIGDRKLVESIGDDAAALAHRSVPPVPGLIISANSHSAADERCDLGLDEVAMIFAAGSSAGFRTQEDTSMPTRTIIALQCAAHGSTRTPSSH